MRSLWKLCGPSLAVFVFVCAVLSASGAAWAQTSSGQSVSSQTGSGRTALNTVAPGELAGAVDLGPLPVSQQMTLTLTLAPSGVRGVALDQFLAELTTPSSPSYHQWLTPAQFAASYGATAEQMTGAVAWAQAQGLTVVSVSPANARLTVSGFASQVESAFAVPLRAYRVNGTSGVTAVWAPAGQPSLPASVATLFSGVDGLDTLPARRALTLAGSATSFAALGELVDANAAPILALNSGLCTTSVSPAQVAEYTALFRQATAQGVTVLSTHTCASGGFPAALADVTAVALAKDAAEIAAPLVVRPAWQNAAGLPGDGMRHGPDVEATSLSALTGALTSIASSAPGNRLGNINAVLYELGPTPGLYTQPDAVPAGTWEAATGLGLVDVQTLVKTWPHGTGSSFTSFSASNYSPMHGQPSNFTSNVTSGTGGATPTGTVTFVTSTGTTVGTATLVNGTATYTETTLDGGSYNVQANYSGDGTYAASSSGTGNVFVQPEPAQLTATVSANDTIGTNFTVTVTDTASSGVGTPSGAVTVTVYGQTTQTVSGTLVPSAANTASTTVSVPSIQVGTLSLEINCTTSLNYSCYNAVNKNVVINRGTPTLKFSYSPTPPVSGQTITLNATVTGVGTAPTPTGNVEFFDGTTMLNAGTLQNGTTTVTGTVPTVATHTITALYQGDPNYNSVNSASTATGPTGTTMTTTALVLSGTAIPQGNALLMTANITPAATVNGTAPTGTVTFSAASQGVLGTASVTGGGAQLQITPAQGSYSITAMYSGDGNYAASTSAASTVTVSAANTSTAVLTATIASLSGAAGTTDPIMASVTVTGGGTPTGPITVSQGTQVLASGNLTSTGANTASVTLSPTLPATAGNYPLTVSCASTDSFVCGNTVGFQVTVTGTATGTTLTTTSLTLTPAAPALGASVVLTATVASATTSATAIAGTVTFSSGTTVLGTGTITNGVATLTTTVTSASEVFTATYGGSTTYAGSSGTASVIAVATIPTSTTLTSSSTQGQAGAGVTLTARVQETGTTSATSASPTGKVTFYVTGNVPLVLGTATVGSAGPGVSIATLTTTQIPSGNQTLYAVYSGDTTFLTSTSASIPIGLSDYAIAFSPVTSTLTQGETANVQMAVTTSGNFTGSILIGCTPPANINLTCTVAGGSLTGSGTAVLTIKTFSSAVARNQTILPGGERTYDLRAIGGVSLAALLCVLLPARGRRRLPALLLVLLAIGLTVNLGCSTNNAATGIAPGNTPLGTYLVTVNSSGTNGVTTVTHDYSYEVTIK